MPPPNDQLHADRFEGLMRTSWNWVPAVFLARVRRMPSVSASTRPPSSSPVIVSALSVAGTKAPVPEGVLRNVAGEPWSS